MKATIKRGGELMLSPESEIEAYAVGLWRKSIQDELGPDMPPIHIDNKFLPPQATVAPCAPSAIPPQR